MNDGRHFNPSSDENIRIYVPKKAAAPAVEALDSEGVRIKSTPRRAMPAAPAIEPTRRMDAFDPDALAAPPRSPSPEPTRRMDAFDPDALAAPPRSPSPEPTRRMDAVKAPAAKSPPLRRTSTANQPVAERKKRDPVSRFFSDLTRTHLRLLLSAVCALLVIAAVVIMVFSGRDIVFPLTGAVTRGFLNDNGSASTPLYNGQSVELQGNALSCFLTADKNNFITQQENGAILCWNVLQKSYSVVCQSGRLPSGIAAVRDSGLLYFDAQDDLHRYTFADGADQLIGRPECFTVADKSCTVLFSVAGSFYILPESASVFTEAGTHKGSPKALAVGDDGKLAVWSDWSNNAQNVYLFNGSQSLLETVVGTTSNTCAVFSDDGKLLAVINPNVETLFLCTASGVTRAKLGSVPASEELYTLAGPLGTEGEGTITGLYLHVSGTAGGNIYYVDSTGEREKLFSKVRSFTLKNGTVCFVASDGILYYSTVNGSTASERVRIAEEVTDYVLSRDGQYVYFRKDVSAGLGTLYAYRIGDEQPEKVSAEADGAYFSCEDGEMLLYYKEPDTVDKYDTRVGLMYLYTYGEGSFKLASDTVIGRLSSGSENGRIRDSSFMYLKYLSSSGRKIYCNCVFYNGKESTPLLKDVYYIANSSLELR